MNIRAELIVTVLCSAVFVMCTVVSVDARQQAAVVPKPVEMQPGEGAFVLTPDTVIIADGAARPVGEYLAALIAPATGTSLEVKTGAADGETKTISIVVDPAAGDHGEEGYSLDVGKSGIKIIASAPAGAFYGVQTLRQLLPAQLEKKSKVDGVEWSVPCVTIKDRPRFRWRGLMIDTARHFFPKEYILEMIDAMAMQKMNRLHLHLTEDQGWRLEIEKFPSLTKIGAWRGKSTIQDELSFSPTGEPHGGFYTKSDMREIIEYAASNYITVMPEIEMPGHSQAALASVPGLSCTEKRLKVLTRWGVNKEVYCAGSEKVFAFLEAVLDEVVELFPGEYVHIGGDEVPKDRWKECPKCQARIKEEGLADEDELQSYFVKRIEKYLDSKGKKLIGWDEILEGGLPPRATVMSWRGTAGGIQAAREGHDVVMSPTSHCYLDYRQAPEGEPNMIGSAVTPLCRVYSFEPVPAELTAEQAAHVLGTQGNLWSEHIPNGEHLEYMAFPRAAALAEVAWSPAELKDWDDFMSRLPALLERFKAAGVNFRPPGDNESLLCD